MKILKEGKNPSWTLKLTCTGKGNRDGGCGAELEVTETDLYQTTSSCLGETDHFTTFMCIGCGAETDVDPKLVPGRILGRVKPLSRSGAEGKRQEILTANKLKTGTAI